MKKILLVDDDTLVLELYRKKLAAGGFEVQTAQDGIEGIKSLGAFKPDLLVLDLMMPKLSGADVLKYMRSQKSLAKVPVVILTNDFMGEQVRSIQALNIAKAVAKGQCTPAKMLETVSQLLGVAQVAALMAEAAPPPTPPAADISQSRDEAREQFLTSAAGSFTDLLNVSEEFAQDPMAASRSGNLADFYRRTHHLAGAASLARCHNVALLGGALEALLSELEAKPQFLNPSTTRTVTAAVEFLGTLITDASTTRRVDIVAGEVLVVDDDALANRIALAALGRANLKCRAVEYPLAVLDLLAQQKFELVLLDVEMPHLTGFELCRKLRLLPGYEKTPVIYVTAHSDFESRARSILSGGNDLIAKPIFPIELAVKAVTHLIRGRLAVPTVPVA